MFASYIDLSKQEFELKRIPALGYEQSVTQGRSKRLSENLSRSRYALRWRFLEFRALFGHNCALYRADL
jgi:hypothetical protein